MAKAMQIFNSSAFGNVRTIEEDGKVLFCGKDIATALGYLNPRKALSDHCRGVTKRDTPTVSGIQELNFIPEGDVYRLITRSKLPAAEKFERWVFDEVVPNVVKGGSYGQPMIDVETITQIVTVACAEIIKQIAPLFKATQQLDICVEPKRPIPKHHHMSLIGRLEPELREEMENLIFSRRYTTREISLKFEQVHGIQISQSSINRYKESMYRQGLSQGNSM